MQNGERFAAKIRRVLRSPHQLGQLGPFAPLRAGFPPRAGGARLPAEGVHQFAEQRLCAVNGRGQACDLDRLEPELLLKQAGARTLLIGRSAEAGGQSLRAGDILPQAGQDVLRIGEVFTERRLRLGRARGGLARLTPLLFELRLQDCLAMRQALPLPLQAPDNLPKFFRLAGRLCHTDLKLPDLAQTDIQRDLPLGHLLSEPLDLPVALRNLGPQPVPLCRETGDLGFAGALVIRDQLLQPDQVVVRRLQRIVRRALLFRRSVGRLTRLLQLSL